MTGTPDGGPVEVIAEAAHASAEATVEAIDAAAAKNDDPEVAEMLEEAALNADATAGRVGWLRAFSRRLRRAVAG